MRTTGREGEEEEEEEHHYHHQHYHKKKKKKKKKKPNKKSNQKREARICKALCCSSSSSNNTKFSISTSSSSSSDDSSQRNSRLSYRHRSFSSLTHYMVQEKLEQMINEREEAKHRENIKKRTRRTRSEGGSTTKFIVMMAMEKCSYYPREDFRDSIIEMILVNRIHGAEELRSLLEHYLLMNPHEYKSIILEIFHEVCTDLFLSSKGHFV